MFEQYFSSCKARCQGRIRIVQGNHRFIHPSLLTDCWFFPCCMLFSSCLRVMFIHVLHMCAAARCVHWLYIQTDAGQAQSVTLIVRLHQLNPAFVTVTPLDQTCLQNAKHRVVSVLMFGDVMQSSLFVVCYECAEAGRERGGWGVLIVKQKESQYFD